MARNIDPAEKWETLWYYMQGGPGVFMGDLYYYFEDGDLRNRIAGGIDTDQCPLYLLTGEYDLSATPEMSAQLAQEVGATHFEVMRGLGHFPMSENYQAFRDYLLPVLDQIRV
ncbi:MAG: alpha/beta hydrolase [Gammaproteobacteria bacterium]|nr:alpha/beta hydrolase [Gammaproteobacteria bacterium]